MKSTKQVQQLQNPTTENIYEHLRARFLELSSMGKIMGHEELLKALKNLTVAVQLQK